jgi:hypothetical protein
MKPAPLLLVVLVSTTTVLLAPALAAPPDEAEQLIAYGIHLRKKGQDFVAGTSDRSRSGASHRARRAC